MDERACLWCKESLADATREDDRQIIRCGWCGVEYSEKLVAQSDPDHWNRMLARDGFRVERDGDAVLVTDLGY